MTAALILAGVLVLVLAGSVWLGEQPADADHCDETQEGRP